MANQQPEATAHQRPSGPPATTGPDKGSDTTGAGAGAVPEADQVYLWIGDDTVAVRCRVHPDFNEVRAYGPDREVPASWMIGLLARHLAQHTAEAANEESAAPVTIGVPLDDFGREVVRRCRWAIEHGAGDPYIKWPHLYQVAVALVLGNHLHLEDVGPGYTMDSAASLLVSSMKNPPADIAMWVITIRGNLQLPGDMWSPSDPPGPLC
ncbi:hypothetical protein [Actinoplanes sp. NPDC051851]|uniref:hypothetical protein n=1 Tax=Actinoplanes sp. NPDC051851 TaxID=3154753 RepID=UPI0034243917